MAAGDAYDNAMFGMADPNGSSAKGSVTQSLSSQEAALKRILSVVAQIDGHVKSISGNAQGVNLSGSSGGGGKGNFLPAATFPSRLIPGLGNNSPIGVNPAVFGRGPVSGNTTKNGGMAARFGPIGTALGEAGVSSILQSGGGLYEQDRLYTSMRLSRNVGGTSINSRGAQSGLASRFAKDFAGSYTSQDDLQQAQYALRNIGFANRNYTPDFANGFKDYARMSNSANAADAMGQFAALNQPMTQNMLRAYGINVRGSDPKQVMSGLFNKVFARVGGHPSANQIETSFQIGNTAYQTAVGMGLDPAAFKDFSMSMIGGSNAVNQSLPGTSKNRAGNSNQLKQVAFGTRISTANDMNSLIGNVAHMAATLDRIAGVHAGAAMGTGLATLGGNPAGGSNVLGSAVNSVMQGLILKTLLGGKSGGKVGAMYGPGMPALLAGNPAGRGGMLRGLGVGAAGAGLSVAGAELSAHGHSNWGKAGTIGGMAMTGAAIGSMIGTPMVGGVIGGLIGGGLGLMSAFGGGGESGGPDSDSGGGGGTYGKLSSLAAGLGGGYEVTSTTGGKHAGKSLHYRGDAIDIGSRPRAGDPANLLRINKYWASKYGSHLSELIYGGPGGISIKNGKVVDGWKVYGAKTMNEHRDHVHVGATPDMLGDASGGGMSLAGGGVAGASGGATGGGIGGSVLAMAEAARDRYHAGARLARVGSGGGGAAGVTAGGGGSVSGNAALGKRLAAAMGWTGGQWNALNSLWSKESGWNNNAQNGHSTAYGIAQFLDSTWAGTGINKTSDPTAQIQAGLKYISSRYGDPSKAWQHSQQNNWYSKGAWRIANDKSANVHEGEMILPSRIAEAVRGEMGRGMASSGRGGGNKVDIHLTVGRATDAEAERFAKKVKRLLEDDKFMHTIATD